MDDFVIYFVAQRIAETIGTLLAEEVELLQGLGEKFKWLQSELRSIQVFLEAADTRHCDDPNILTWVADVKEVACDVADIIDTYCMLAAHKTNRRSRNYFKRVVTKPGEMVSLHCMGTELEVIFARIEEIAKRRGRYDFTSVTTEKVDGSSGRDLSLLRQTYCHTTGDDIRIGSQDDQTNTLVAELMKVQDRLAVVSIYGMGGLGKTTLAKMVYNHRDVKTHFDCHAWVFISQQCRIEDVLREILRKVSALTQHDTGEMECKQLVETLFHVLQGKRYLVVLDDVWDKHTWDRLKPAFPVEKKGSKVLLTTRNKEISKYADPWSLHLEPRTLKDDEAWHLICGKAIFPRADADLQSRLSLLTERSKCGREMASKCGGLPLAIVILGRILATKESLTEWETVARDMNRYISNGQVGLTAILGLSYDDLPYKLKPLFLYLGLFPKDHGIPVKDLIRMWIAEGLVSDEPGNPALTEDMGRKCLEELIERCMVQIGERDMTGRIKTCQMNHLIRDVCLSKAREVRYLEIIRKTASSEPSFPSSSTGTASMKLSRCAVYLEDEKYAFPQHLSLNLYTVFFIREPTFKDSTILRIAHSDLMRVKVLELKGIRLGPEFTKFIGKLVYLRYLGLRDTNLRKLPKSIRNLVFLQTLDVRNNCLQLPNVIWEMRELRHLRVDKSCDSGSVKEMEVLSKLQTLSCIRVGSWKSTGTWMSDLAKLTGLVKLGMVELTTNTANGVLKSVVDGLDGLRSLTLSLKNGSFSDLLGQLYLKHDGLLKMRLEGNIDNFPMQWPSKLVKLRLMHAKLNQDPMPALQNLQHLVHLSLWNSYQGNEMQCSSKGFPQLQYLEISRLPELEELKIEKGAMPRLTTFFIRLCEKLQRIPQEFQFASALTKLHIAYMPEMFCERVRSGGQDWHIAQHIPNITIQDVLEVSGRMFGDYESNHEPHIPDAGGAPQDPPPF